MTYMFSLDGLTGAINGPNRGANSVASPHAAWSGGIPIPLGPTAVSNLTGYRVVLMKAHYLSPTIPAGETIRLHSYQMRVENGGSDDLGYWEAPAGSPPPDGQYIVHYQGGLQNFEVATRSSGLRRPVT